MERRGDTKKHPYDRVAPWYETLAAFYSLGAIAQAKASQIDAISKNSKVLYAGAGACEDALLAARKGACVTCVDLSPAMLARARARFEAEGLHAEFLCMDIMDHRDSYDVVVANFFLNLFAEPLMRSVLEHLVALLGSSGMLLISDFSPAESRGSGSLVQNTYYRFANLFFWLLRLAPLHPIHDYSVALEELGFEVQEIQFFSPVSLLPARGRSVGYQSIRAVRR